jgi:hypothetical protein
VVKNLPTLNGAAGDVSGGPGSLLIINRISKHFKFHQSAFSNFDSVQGGFVFT